jgi:hypothetical protein
MSYKQEYLTGKVTKNIMGNKNKRQALPPILPIRAVGTAFVGLAAWISYRKLLLRQ